MNKSRTLQVIAVLACAAIVILAFGPVAESAVPGMAAARPAAPVWIAPAALLQPLAAPPAPRTSGLPSSARGAQAATCSVTTEDMYDTWCSAGADREGQDCSALCDSGATCSAIQAGDADGWAQCSAMGVGEPLQNRCSLLTPPSNGSGAFCSALGVGRHGVYCSIVGSDPDAICSTKMRDPNTNGHNVCSASTGGVETNLEPPSCSALTWNHSGNVCSAFHPGGAGKFCSTLSPEAFCSVFEEGQGRCTALFGAAPQHCSVDPLLGSESGARCSTIVAEGICEGSD